MTSQQVLFRHQFKNDLSRSSDGHSPWQSANYVNCSFGLMDEAPPKQSAVKTIYMADNSCMQVRPQNGFVSSGTGQTTLQEKSFTLALPITHEQVYASLASLACVAVPAAVMTVLATQLMLALRPTDNNAYLSSFEASARLSDLTKMESVWCSVAMSFASFTLSFSISAMFTALLQLFLCLKALKLSADSHVKIMQYLRQGMYLRLASFVGFFISIPIFLVVIISCYATGSSLFGSSVTAAVLTVIGASGLLVCVLTMAHSVYAWLWGVLNLPEYELQNDQEKLVIDKNLSTLV